MEGVNNRKEAFDRHLDTPEFRLATARKKPKSEEQSISYTRPAVRQFLPI